MPLAPRAGTPTALTVNPAGIIPGVMVGVPASATIRASATRMHSAATTTSAAIHRGRPLRHNHQTIQDAPSNKPPTQKR